MIKAVRDILRVFEQNNLFDEGVELIGSWCFQLYQKHFDVPFFPLQTQDIDFLIPNPFKGKRHENFVTQLEDLGFQVDHRNDGSLYLWNSELKIEFITPEKGRGVSSSIKVKKLGLNAIPMRYVSLLLSDTVTVKEDGIGVRIPHPVNYCLHKFLIVSRRKNEGKALKDLQQAVHVSISVDLKELSKVFRTLPRTWQKMILRMLDRAKDKFPQMEDEIQEVNLTLQNIENT